MNLKRLLPCLTAILLASPLAFGSTIAKWTFETSQPGINTLPAAPGAGVPFTSFSPETGSGTATALHAAASIYSSPAGNGSAHSFSSTNWSIGDYYQFSVSTVGFQNISVTFDQYSSGTGPGRFTIQYSTDGSTWTQFGGVYNVTNSPTWSSGTPKDGTSYSFDLSSILALNNTSTIYIRLVDASTTSASGGTVGTSGTDRVDNFTVSASGAAGAPLIITQPPTNTITYWGDTVNLSVLVSGTDPLTYQWYYPNLSTPLSDASSGYGVGLITNTATSMLTLTYVDTAQAGNYQVIINNSLGSATSVVAHLTVNVRTPIVTNIAYLRSLLNRTTGLPTDMTNIYSVTGLVTTPFNLSTTLNSTEFFMQDGTVGICVYYGGDFGNHLPNEGDVVRAIGPMGSFNGLYQFNLSFSNPSHSVSSALSTGNPLPTPKYFNISKYSNIPYMETNIEGSLVVVSNVFLNQSSLQFASGASNITNVWHQYISLYVNPNASDVIGHDVPRIAASIVGVLSHFTTGYELDILHYSDLTSTTNIPPMPLYITGARTNYVVDWWAVSPFTLQWASSPTGTYHDLTGVTTPYTNHYDSTVKFFRLKQ